MNASYHPPTAGQSRSASHLLRIDTVTGNRMTFRAVLRLDDGNEVSAEVTARQLVTYRSFAAAVLEKTGVLFGHGCYERRGGAGYWREEVQRALEAGK